jgi:predicted dehydrogenase
MNALYLCNDFAICAETEPIGSMKMPTRPRIAIIGCGAVAEQRYVPALRSRKWIPTALVDPSAERRHIVAKAVGARAAEGVRPVEIIDAFDAAIAALPHALHEPLCVELLRAGKHVFVEKPMAATSAECAVMNRAAAEGNAKLAVGLLRRQSSAGQWLKEALDAGVLGAPRRFTIRDGYEYAWPLATDSMWRREAAGGGVLIDTGAHTMDQVVWWFGQPDEVEYFDDSDGGVEADCLIKLRWRSGLEGEVELSRTRTLTNSLVLTCEKAKLQLSTGGNEVRILEGDVEFSSPRVGRPPFPMMGSEGFFIRQLEAFEAYIRGEPSVIASGIDGAQSVALIERCYASRRRLDLPWIAYASVEAA